MNGFGLMSCDGDDDIDEDDDGYGSEDSFDSGVYRLKLSHG
jgi:hypothetical protein